MIKSIRLKNFQGHKDTTIECDSGINTIIGSSCAGKSSVMRGLKWVIDNRPSGNAIVSYWNRDKKGAPKDDTSVTIETVDGDVITRVKNKNLNGYVINGEELSAVGTNSPDEVGEILGINELNIHSQLAPHFLISQTNGEIAKYLNSLINLDVIDDLLSIAEKDKRANKKDMQSYKEEIDTVEKAMEALSWVDKAETLVQELSAMDEESNQLKDDIDNIDETIVEYEGLEGTLKAIESNNTKATKMVGIIDDLLTTANAIDKDAKTLNRQLDLYDKHARTIETSFDSEKAMGICATIDALNVEFNKVKDVYVALEGRKTRVIRLIDDIKEAEEELVELEAQLPDTCPLCGGKINA